MRQKIRPFAIVVCCACLFNSPVTTHADDTSFELRDGDRVVLLGGTLIEREQRYGYWETALTAAYPERNVTFRNLGWSGDTVWGESRGMFDPPEKGYERLVELARELKPTVIVLGYGNVEAFAGEAGLASFIEQYGRLIDDLSSTGARFVLLAPLTMENLGPPLPDPSEYNANVEEYRTAIADLAAERDAHYAPLQMPSPDENAGRHPTDNGQQLNGWGYWMTSDQVRNALCPDATGPKLDLLTPAMTDKPPESVSREIRPLEELRRAIIRKNQLFFYRWRPQNFTYLFGFRKHEQGQNAAEVAEFDPLVAAVEEEIAGIRETLPRRD
jgi:hypothetical protein